MTEENKSAIPAWLKHTIGVTALIALMSGFYLHQMEIDERLTQHNLQVEQQKEKEKNKVYSIVQLERFEGRIKTIANVSGHLLIVLEDVPHLGEVNVPTYDSSDIRLQEVVTFYYVSLVRNNKEYVKGYILRRDFLTIDNVDDTLAESLYQLLKWSGPRSTGRVY